MKIVHVFVDGPFIDNSSYQQDLLAKYHQKIYGDTILINSNLQFMPDGSKQECEIKEYVNNYGVKIIRFKSFSGDKKLFYTYRLYKLLCELKPDFLMLHAFSTNSSLAVTMYKKKFPSCKLIADTHVLPEYEHYDRVNFIGKLFLFAQKVVGLGFYRSCHRIYGIASQGLDMVEKYLGVPRNITEVLPLGYDDELIKLDKRDYYSKVLRENYNISDNTWIIVHGGKLSRNKKTIELVKSISQMNDVHLFIFGEFESEKYKSEVVDEIKNNNVDLLGFYNQEQIVELYLGADMAVFPGAPSVLRQQAVACGLPIIMKTNAGDEDINIIINDNGIALDNDWKDYELYKAIRDMVDNIESYSNKALDLANGEFKRYSYREEARYIVES